MLSIAREFLAAISTRVMLTVVGTIVTGGAACSSEREVRVAFDDTRMGRVELRGMLHPARNSKRALVIVHGLGDDHDAPAITQAAEVAQQAGWATFRVSLRGADKSGQGFYVATPDDVAQAVASGALAKYETIALFGFSLGGHNVLRYAASPKIDPRVKAAVAVSAPLDLAKTAALIDASQNAPAVIASLAAQYRPFHDEMMKRGKLQWLPNPDRVARFKSLKQFDDEVSGPIAGRKDAADYWAKESAGAFITDIKIPVALIAGEGDPLVPIASLRAALQDAPPLVQLFAVDGGHITMSPSMTMKQRAPDGLMPQALAWVEQMSARRPQ